jgi:hypothetical protein
VGALTKKNQICQQSLSGVRQFIIRWILIANNSYATK